MVSESFTKAILFLIKNSISFLDQPPSGPITFHKTPPFFFQAEDGIRDQPRSRGLGDVYKRQQL